MDWKQQWRLVADKADYGTSDSCSDVEEATARTISNSRLSEW